MPSYRPIFVNGIIYKHPLGLNLYNFHHSKENIALIKKAIIFESEKSCLQYQSYFGIDNDITVACCGSNISSQQIQMLLNLNVEEEISPLNFNVFDDKIAVFVSYSEKEVDGYFKKTQKSAPIKAVAVLTGALFGIAGKISFPVVCQEILRR